MKRGNPNISERGRATRFKPGQSGNPKGRPKKESSIRSWLKELEDKSPPLTKEDAAKLKKYGYENPTRAQLLAERLWSDALSGSKDSQRMVLDYTIGRPVPLTDMVVSVQTAVANINSNTETVDPYKQLVALMQALVRNGVLPAEALARFLPQQQ